MSPPDESHANNIQDPELRASFVRLYRTRESHQWAEPASPASDPPLPAKIIQFPLFPDSTRPVSNAMARSALFSCIRGKDRRFIKDVPGDRRGSGYPLYGEQLNKTTMIS